MCEELKGNEPASLCLLCDILLHVVLTVISLCMSWCLPFASVQGIAILCLELEKLKLVGNEPATLYDFAVLDALWSGIVQSAAAMQSFLLADGLGTLLDVLDCGAAALKPLLLTLIAGR